jgi:AraC-like DNA-binding protein
MPSSTVDSFVDPWEFQSAFGAAKLLLTAPGTYQSELTRIDLHRLWVSRAAVSLPLVSQVAAPKGRTSIHFLADAHQTPIRQNGIELPPGVVVVCPSGAEHHCRTSTEVRWGAMSLTPDDLAVAGRALVDCELTASSGMIRLIQPPPRLMSRLLKLHDEAGNLAATAPDILAHPEVSRAMEQELLHVMVGCLAEGLAVGTNPPRQRQAVMRRFERFMEANPNKSIYVPEVCAAVAVSERTLRHYCDEHLGMGPNKYLWLRRMNLARRALATADPRGTTVTTIALEYGFGELGRFSVAYRQLFGESPSATLRGAANVR